MLNRANHLSRIETLSVGFVWPRLSGWQRLSSVSAVVNNIFASSLPAGSVMFQMLLRFGFDRWKVACCISNVQQLQWVWKLTVLVEVKRIREFASGICSLIDLSVHSSMIYRKRVNTSHSRARCEVWYHEVCSVVLGDVYSSWQTSYQVFVMCCFYDSPEASRRAFVCFPTFITHTG